MPDVDLKQMSPEELTANYKGLVTFEPPNPTYAAAKGLTVDLYETELKRRGMEPQKLPSISALSTRQRASHRPRADTVQAERVQLPGGKRMLTTDASGGHEVEADMDGMTRAAVNAMRRALEAK